MKVLCEYFSVPCFAPLLLFVVDHHQNQPEKLRNFLLVGVGVGVGVVVWAMRRRRRGKKRKILGVVVVVGVVLDSDPFRNSSSWFCAPFLSW